VTGPRLFRAIWVGPETSCLGVPRLSLESQGETVAIRESVVKQEIPEILSNRKSLDFSVYAEVRK
jgi:hypothetical protein